MEVSSLLMRDGLVYFELPRFYYIDEVCWISLFIEYLVFNAMDIVELVGQFANRSLRQLAEEWQ